MNTHFPTPGSWKYLPVLMSLAMLLCSGRPTAAPTTAPATTATSGTTATPTAPDRRFIPQHYAAARGLEPASTQEAKPPDWKEISSIVGVEGVLHKDVYEITVPRKDLHVTVIGEPIPPEAGMASVFHLWLCTCGKTVLYGEFCLPDYEVSDVMDALRSGGVQVTGISNILISERPHLLSVHFYAEGEPKSLAQTLKAALDCTGDARSVKQPLR
jgi:hypothetical protein